jgi:hypothetical protein
MDRQMDSNEEDDASGRVGKEEAAVALRTEASLFPCATRELALDDRQRARLLPACSPSGYQRPIHTWPKQRHTQRVYALSMPTRHRSHPDLWRAMRGAVARRFIVLCSAASAIV